MDSNPTGAPTRDGQRLIDTWLKAAEHVEELKRQENRAWCDLRNAESELVKWLKPKDWKPGELFAIWSGDSLIQVLTEHTVEQDGVKTLIPDQLQIRTRGREI